MRKDWGEVRSIKFLFWFWYLGAVRCVVIGFESGRIWLEVDIGCA